MRAPQADGDEVRDRGYATSAEQALAGAWAVAFPVALPERYGPACVMLVTLSADESDRLIAAGRRAVAEVELRSVRR
ncbi:hypothetical protein [Leucobacter chromiireducens]|uniref:hypothetical protein n=1 Tax=Leucobacter chromiireducens TaxID=283877 RepID=UPI001F14BF1C|nr:hypothetical protein [Leucobacter chromiireducens]